MSYCLTTDRVGRSEGFVSRFDPRFWSINFPRPMMAAVTTTGPDCLRVDCVFYRQDDLAGLIWEAEDRFDHPLLAYETARISATAASHSDGGRAACGRSMSPMARC